VKKQELPHAPPPHYIVNEKECNKKPFNYWFEIFSSVFSLRTHLYVINTRINLITKWINGQDDSYEKRASIHLLKKLSYALNGIFLEQNDKAILEIKDDIASFLPSEIYKHDFMQTFEEKEKVAKQLAIRRAQSLIEELIEEIETTNSIEIVQSFHIVSNYLSKMS